jgi:ribonuclease T1
MNLFEKYRIVYFLCFFVLGIKPVLAKTTSVTFYDLPTQAQKTIILIKQGGPFPYARDGIIFGNFEKKLPHRPYKYYREYTVQTPGIPNRGAKRIIVGGLRKKRSHEYPKNWYADIYFYTPDHYHTFYQIDMALTKH